MSLEIETKIKVDAHEPVRQRLAQRGASLRDQVIETDTLFDRPDGSLRARGVALRLRRVVRASDSAFLRTVLTVKGPVLAGAVKTREELEQEIADADVMVHMLELLGFPADLTYQKRREIWSFRDCLVCLDEPAHLGNYVEIEGPDKRSVLAVQAELGLAEYPHTRSSYAAMMTAYCESRGISPRQVMLP